mmetsp:Transcript_112689/g.318429  ORF Transcript_112689/g.318429 Transcript_112689/m.318429 type:complete len:202 (-) Transcript_112689:169-774(-)
MLASLAKAAPPSDATTASTASKNGPAGETRTRPYSQALIAIRRDRRPRRKNTASVASCIAHISSAGTSKIAPGVFPSVSSPTPGHDAEAHQTTAACQQSQMAPTGAEAALELQRSSQSRSRQPKERHRPNSLRKPGAEAFPAVLRGLLLLLLPLLLSFANCNARRLRGLGVAIGSGAPAAAPRASNDWSGASRCGAPPPFG